MNADCRIRELVMATLASNHDVDGVRFIDQLLLVVAEVGEIKCSLVEERALRFQTPTKTLCEVEVGRTKSKLRLLCARLSVLCNESNGPEVSLYGGEGIIKRAALGNSSQVLHDQPAAGSAVGTLRHAPAGLIGGAAALLGLKEKASGGSSTVTEQWSVRFKNTPSEQEFIIQAQ